MTFKTTLVSWALAKSLCPSSGGQSIAQVIARGCA